MSDEIEKGEEFALSGFLYSPIVDISKNNGIRLSNGQEFYLHPVIDDRYDEGNYFYLSDERDSKELEICGVDKLMKNIPLLVTNPSLGGSYYNRATKSGFEVIVLKRMDESNGKFNEGIWPLADEKLLICTDQSPFELIFEKRKGKPPKPIIQESHAFLEALNPKKYKRGRSYGLNLTPELKEVYLPDNKVECFGHWYPGAVEVYIELMKNYREDRERRNLNSRRFSYSTTT